MLEDKRKAGAVVMVKVASPSRMTSLSGCSCLFFFFFFSLFGPVAFYCCPATERPRLSMTQNPNGVWRLIGGGVWRKLSGQ